MLRGVRRQAEVAALCVGLVLLEVVEDDQGRGAAGFPQPGEGDPEGDVRRVVGSEDAAFQSWLLPGWKPVDQSFEKEVESKGAVDHHALPGYGYAFANSRGKAALAPTTLAMQEDAERPHRGLLHVAKGPLEQAPSAHERSATGDPDRSGHGIQEVGFGGRPCLGLMAVGGPRGSDQGTTHVGFSEEPEQVPVGRRILCIRQ